MNPPSGDETNLEKAYPITFRDGGATDAETMGTTIQGPFTVACKDDMKCDYAPNKGAATGLTNFAGFAATQSMGLWKFCVGDSSMGDTGVIDAVKMTLVLQ